MIKTNKQLFNQDGTTFIPEFFLKINIWEKNNININITNLEGTELYWNGFALEHTQEVKDFIEYVSNITKAKIQEHYPQLDDLEIINL